MFWVLVYTSQSTLLQLYKLWSKKKKMSPIHLKIPGKGDDIATVLSKIILGSLIVDSEGTG